MNLKKWSKKLTGKDRGRSKHELAPEEIFLDSSNLPLFDTAQFEGRIEKPISKLSFIFAGLIFFVIFGVYTTRLWNLQIVEGANYEERGLRNTLRQIVFFADRGIIYDRNGKKLAWNFENETDDFAVRRYATTTGLAHVLGYIRNPAKDSNGYYYSLAYEGVDGIEKYFNEELTGSNGIKLIEIDALGKVESENIVSPPKAGGDIHLTIDAETQSAMYNSIATLAKQVGFEGGAGALIDVRNGEVIAMTSYPEFSSELLSSGLDSEAVTKLLKDSSKPFLNRFTQGLYTPGSIVKPFVALAALNENIISPDKEILSTGSIIIPNIYHEGQDSVFNDWKAHGYVDMRDAIAVSSNVYFYEVGGGYKDQKGLGITKIHDYMNRFGFGIPIEKSSFFSGPAGNIPNPEWKREVFDDEWRVGDTYFTSIGQYSFQVVPMQALLATAMIANSGNYVEPKIVISDEISFKRTTNIPVEDFNVVKEGMRQGVSDGIARALNIPTIKVAAKTGTAELGTTKQFVNSWIVGFFPYDEPRYAFVILMEKGSRANLYGAVVAGRSFMDWFSTNRMSDLTN